MCLSVKFIKVNYKSMYNKYKQRMHVRTVVNTHSYTKIHFNISQKSAFIFQINITTKAVDNAFVLRSKPMVTKGQRLQHQCIYDSVVLCRTLY